jgi:hypothetical protein
METELGNPIEYSPELPEKDEPLHNEELDAPYYLPHPSMMMQHPHQMMQPQMEKNDFLSNLDKNAYIIIFVSFILGFFMGKTMQPVILRPG